jgi:hypothetical protein
MLRNSQTNQFIVPTLNKLFQNPTNISKSRKKNINSLSFCQSNEKNKTKTKQRERIQDVVEVVSSNTFASIQQVSEDNLKEFLVSILCLCIQK